MSTLRYKILVLPRTYPGRVHPLKGIFVRKQVEAQFSRDDMAVLHIIADPNLSAEVYDVSSTLENGCRVVRVFYRKNDLAGHAFAPLIKLFRHLQAGRIGFRRIVADFGIPDLAHVHMALPGGFLALWLKWNPGIPYLVTEHLTDYMERDGSYVRAHPLYRLLTRLVCRQSDAVAAVSHPLLRALAGHHLLKQPGRVIANVVDDAPRAAEQERPHRPVTFITVSLLSDRQKNLSGLLRAFAQALEQEPGLCLKIVGDGPDRTDLELLARELRLEDRVTFAGYVANENMAACWQQADVFVLNSRFETFSVATAEALLHGLPVIVTACGGPEEFVTAACGLVIATENDTVLTHAIVQMSRSYAGYDRQAMRHTIQSRFSAAVVSAEYHGVYAALMRSWPVGFAGERIRVDEKGLVLDVGSGHNPNRRADILLERELEASIHRSGARAAIPAGKQLVIGDAQQMPFRNGVFAFVIASHIAEHIPQPALFLQEMQRVGRAGYLETPGPLSEWLLTEPYHLWILERDRDELVFRSKRRSRPFSDLFYKWFYLNEERYGHATMRSSNTLVLWSRALLLKVWKRMPGTYTKYHWQSHIRFRIQE